MPLDDLMEFVNAIGSSNVGQLARLRRGLSDEDGGHAGLLYCPQCSGYSGMKLEGMYFDKTVGQELFRELIQEDCIGGPPQKLPEFSDPSLFNLDCVNCDNYFYALLYKGPNGPTLVFFSVRGGGLSTPNTPEMVRYYLEQAYKAQASCAYSAALTMYRAALEQLLEDKGLKGNLPAKLAKLNEDIENGIAATWAKRLNVEVLGVVKQLCNSHAHANELAKLKAIDSAFMSKIQRTFSSLLNTAYELEPLRAAAKANLEAALKKAKKK